MHFFKIRSLLFLILSTAVFLFSCKSEKKDKPVAGGPRKQGPLTVDGFVVKQSSVSENVQVPGSLLPFEETQIRAEVGGRIVRLNINEGSHVAKGTLLVKLFDEDLQALLKKLQVQLKIAEKTEERNRELLKINGISQQEYDLSQLGVENLKADIESTNIAISKTEIRAPYSGVIGLRNVSLGSYVSPQDIIAVIRQVDQLKLEFAVPEKYARDMNRGYIVRFRVDGGERDHQGVVIATESSVNQTTRTLLVRAQVKGNNKELVPGIFAKINLQLGKNDQALLVPSQAVIPTARNKQVALFKKDSVTFAVVETGIRDSAFVQVLSGLKAGDTIITTGLMAIRPNAKVKIKKVNSL
ncbi:efflux RND transporter periplasmic adaptor subunit [Chryseosolibacter indicus]|uniref:Efflux RND transporter periplasmic adaptor subunit n=1 Tax=Chryseosolibacter indicus TaxID=2782351 RepID=A0ABS5VRV5_9BACT|nr:efflux RND transporter periplasmic adaptor subunit [Chryseosolibacter indicus]MBT1703565.1 efflux RND transporter periplasmic adaptor subunit [Chryseosolibacter indicus]